MVGRCAILMLVALLALCSAAYSEDISAIKLNGHLTQGGLVWGRAPVGAVVKLDGETIKTGEEGHFVFGFGRDAPGEATLSIMQNDRVIGERTLSISRRSFNIERVNGLPPKTVSPPPEWTERRKIETGRVAKGRSLLTNDLNWAWGFDKPAEGRFSGFYGSQRILNGEPRSPHYGLDIANETGTPIHAPAGGIITLAAADFLLEGGIVIIDHGFGVTSTLFHMDSVDVEEGARIIKGQKIGTIGAKGRASGPHVDWRVNWRSVRLDPGLLIRLE